MSQLEQLIKELCPNRVVLKSLKEIAEVKRGVRVIKSQLSETDGFPVFQNSLTPLGYHDKANVPANSTFVIAAGAAGEIGYSKQEFWAADDCYYFDCELLNNRFLYHVLLQNQQSLLSKVRKASIPRLPRTAIEQMSVPVLPFSIQEEIVRILDSFTELEAELEAELEERKKQYEYYRNTLLDLEKPTGFERIDQLIKENCPDGVPYLKIADICQISRGRVISKDFIRDNPGSFPVYSSQTESNGVLGYISEYDYDGEYLTWTTDGAHAGTVFYRQGKFCVTNVCGLLKVTNSEVCTRFLFFVLSTIAKKFVNLGMGNPKLMSNVMARILIPIPPLPVQQEIVRILDRFDNLCNDLSVGLPAEIEARRKQYEYYRDKLLTFK